MPCLLLNIIGDTSKRIRGLITAQGVERYSSYNFMEVTCRSKNKTGDSSSNAFHRLIADESKILELTEYIRFPGAKQETPTMTQTFRGLQRLLMILGCRVATSYRDWNLMESTLTQVMGGDTSLVNIIEANAASTEPVGAGASRANTG